ncbi:DUF485 domain-containing protein [Streptacidiphilus sp. N1-12]|uniref:DUF485 domain-containing protein n=3 Tax=Streptacidiphilus alkalitolerans TaxID=3342712 RepID=A0ABV6VKI1_9ACTN
MPAGGGPEQGGGGFDWWAAPQQRAARPPEAVSEAAPFAEVPVPEARVGVRAEAEAGAAAETAAEAEAPTEVMAELVQAAPVRAVEPEPDPGPSSWFGAGPEPDPGPEPPAAESAAAVYRHVQAGEEFQEIRREYRSFVFPACAAFLAWYLLYIIAAVTLPALMDRQVAGPFNVAWVLGLLQFASTFLITWLYARHARDRRDRMALGLRWETQDRLR